MNSIGLDADRDLGQDGTQQSTFNKDEYAYALNYYDGDYEARGGTDLLGETFYTNEKYSLFTGYQDKVGGVAYNRESLYNGNIAAMSTSIRNLGEEHATQSMNYRYDQLHRIAAAHATKWYEGNWTTRAGSYNTSYDYDKNGNIQSLYRNDRDAVTIDDLEYYYDGVKKNRLDAVKDIGGTAEGLGNTEGYEYTYDKIGNLVKNATDGIENIEWNIYGKVTKVTKTPDQFGIQATIDYKYDGTGNRIMKKVTVGATSTTTTYLRDASGNVMAIYEEKTDQTLAIKEIPIYGSSRLGQYRPKTDTKKTALGQRIYEFSNHLGNVLVTLTDHKVPQTDGTYESVVVSASDYYPFGMAMKERTYSNSEYRYGFNGKENDTDFGSHIQDYGFRLYSRESARFLSVDPLTKDYPELTTYQFASNTPIQAIDLDGLEMFQANTVSRLKQKGVRVSYHGEIMKVTYKFKGKQFSTTISWNGPEAIRVKEIKTEYSNGNRSNLWELPLAIMWYYEEEMKAIYSFTNEKAWDGAAGSLAYTLAVQMNANVQVSNQEKTTFEYENTFLHFAGQTIATILFGEGASKFAADMHERKKEEFYDIIMKGHAEQIISENTNPAFAKLLEYYYIDQVKDLINNESGRKFGVELQQKHSIERGKQLTIEQVKAILVDIQNHFTNENSGMKFNDFSPEFIEKFSERINTIITEYAKD